MSNLQQHWNAVSVGAEERASPLGLDLRDPADMKQAARNGGLPRENEMFQSELLDQNGQRIRLQEQARDPVALNELREKKNKERDAADDLYELAQNITAQQVFDNIQQTRAELNDFSGMLDQEQIELDKMATELEDNAITMGDGRKVYFDSETGRYVFQGEDGAWQELQNEEEIEEASARHQAMGKVSTRQDKDKHTRLQQEHNSATLFVSSANDRLDRIEQQLADGKITPEEAERQRQAVEEDTQRYREDYDSRQSQRQLSPEDLEEQAAKQDAAQESKLVQQSNDVNDDFGFNEPPKNVPSSSPMNMG